MEISHSMEDRFKVGDIVVYEGEGVRHSRPFIVKKLRRNYDFYGSTYLDVIDMDGVVWKYFPDYLFSIHKHQQFKDILKELYGPESNTNNRLPVHLPSSKVYENIKRLVNKLAVFFRFNT